MKLKNRSVLLTGATSGIGRALAEKLSAQGCHLILPARRIERLESFRSAGAEIAAVDFSNTEETLSFAKELASREELPSVLILNAGLSQRSSALETAHSVDRELMEVNYFAPIILAKELLPKMMKREKAHIAVISSLVGKFATPNRSAYAASKHALHGFFDALRAEHPKNKLAVSLICPGYINTELPLHAKTADGSPQGEMDVAQLKGMTTESFAPLCIKAIEQEKSEVYIGGKERFAVYLKRFYPTLFERLISSYKTVKESESS